MSGLWLEIDQINSTMTSQSKPIQPAQYELQDEHVKEHNANPYALIADKNKKNMFIWIFDIQQSRSFFIAIIMSNHPYTSKLIENNVRLQSGKTLFTR